MGPNFREILPLLARNNVRFILIGGGAATAHGSARITYDVDVVYGRDPENLRNLVAALQPHQPYPHDTRVYRLHRFPYLVVFFESPASVQVIAVAHARRRPGYWQRRLP